MQVNDGFDDGQPQATTWVGGSIAPAVETGEQMGHVSPGDADAGVRYA